MVDVLGEGKVVHVDAGNSEQVPHGIIVKKADGPAAGTQPVEWGRDDGDRFLPGVRARNPVGPEYVTPADPQPPPMRLVRMERNKIDGRLWIFDRLNEARLAPTEDGDEESLGAMLDGLPDVAVNFDWRNANPRQVQHDIRRDTEPLEQPPVPRVEASAEATELAVEVNHDRRP